jgi:RHS repeat-associated protein
VGTSSLAHSANGEMTTDEEGNALTYDAWGKLRAWDDPSTVGTDVTYAHDALGRRIARTDAAGDVRHDYHSAQWQVLEERDGNGDTITQYVWSPAYVDALILRDRDTTGDGTLDERLWPTHDANFNVTALVDDSGVVLERYVYDPYGLATVLDADWTADADGQSDVLWSHLHQGGRLDAATGLYHFRHRDYDAALMRWTRQDPMGYVDGMSMTLYVIGSPVLKLDPNGLFAKEKKSSIEVCFHTGFKSGGFSSHKYIKIGGKGYGFYAASHLDGSSTFWDDVKAVLYTGGHVVDDDHKIPENPEDPNGPRSECWEVWVNLNLCDFDKFEEEAEKYAKEQLDKHGKGKTPRLYSITLWTGVDCNTWASEVLHVAEAKACNKCHPDPLSTENEFGVRRKSG